MRQRKKTWEPIAIHDAYDELTRSAFAVWIRLLTCTPRQLAMGRNKICKVLGYSQERSDVVLRELANKGFILFHPKGVGKPTAVLIQKRARINGPHGFVRV